MRLVRVIVGAPTRLRWFLGAAIAIVAVGYEPPLWFVALAFVFLALDMAVWFLEHLNEYLNDRLDRKLEQARRAKGVFTHTYSGDSSNTNLGGSDTSLVDADGGDS